MDERESGSLEMPRSMSPRMWCTTRVRSSTGYAAEVTPIRSIDKIMVGSGRRGPVTGKLQEELFAYVNGEREDIYHWLTYL